MVSKNVNKNWVHPGCFFKRKIPNQLTFQLFLAKLLIKGHNNWSCFFHVFVIFSFFKDTPCQCGLSNGNGVQDAPINRVINGQEALPNEFPWQVALVRAGGHTPICGGSIISDRHVLTAAHCTNDIKGM